uniref:Uncharacterized protein n=1 Tax=Rhizophora mucronata TaxID=61149 RepID=A0A2P2MUZ7_RHIMU
MEFNGEALMGFCGMVNNGILANNLVMPNVLKAYGALQWIGFGRVVHG